MNSPRRSRVPWPYRGATARPLAIVAAVILTITLAAPFAQADGDPASDVLIGENVFYPYSPSVSPALQRTLDAETAAASAEHFPIKVALIPSPVDLGSITSLFGEPQHYASFLDIEISYLDIRQLVLVVMPNGYGVSGLGRAATLAARTLTKPSGGQSNDLARAAIVAVARLASAAGHPIQHISTTSTADGGNGWQLPTAAIVGLAAIAAAGTILAFRHRHARAR